MKPARRLLERYENLAETFEQSGRLDDAIATVELGAMMAATCHPGQYASLRFERLLARAGATLRPMAPRPKRSAAAVLHVATETYAVGGHTRMIWRWADRDPSRTHSLVLTTPGSEPPTGLAAAIAASGGAVHSLPAGASNLDRAQALRDLAAEVDVVVVHTHAMDPLPTVAFAEADHRPPVVVFNHADHLFWLGVSIADVLHCIRPVAVDFAVARGIAAERCVLTTAPVTGSDGNAAEALDPAVERTAVLERFGWPGDSVILFSAGAAYKYRGPEGTTLLDLVDAMFRGDSRLRLLVAGPKPDDSAFSAAAARSGQRIAALGPVPNLAPYFAAADIYLESRPFGGPGASSEAAAHGLPVLTHGFTALEASLFTTDARYGATLVIGPRDYRAALTGLIADPERRAQQGAQARETIAATDDEWAAGVDHVTQRALRSQPVMLDELRPIEGADGPRDVLIDVHIRLMQGIDATRMLPVADRVAVLARSPAVRAAYGDITTIITGPQRRYRAAVALGTGDPADLRPIVAELRRLHALSVVDRLAIGLPPDQADGAVPVLEAELEDDSITVDVFIDTGYERLVGPDCLEVVAPGASGTGRAPIHEFER